MKCVVHVIKEHTNKRATVLKARWSRVYTHEYTSYQRTHTEHTHQEQEEGTGSGCVEDLCFQENVIKLLKSTQLVFEVSWFL